MKPEFICHKDFAEIQPVNVFHKECDNSDYHEEDSKYINRHILFCKKNQRK